MNDRSSPARFRLPIPILFGVLFLAYAAAGTATLGASDKPGGRDLVQPAALARQLSGPVARRPMLVHVGFDALYRGGHVPGSLYAGPASRPDGIRALANALQPVARDRNVVLYCGCCPWSHCPNVGPAFREARRMGFRNVKVLYVARDLQHDWADKGLPMESGAR